MALLDPRSFEATSSSEEQTIRLGARLGAVLPERAVIALKGGLGAGKTAFARGVGEGWGAQTSLRSPTFTLIQKYTRAADAAVLYHVDLYRIEALNQLNGIGLRELIEDEPAVFLVEWPEHADTLIPPEAMQVAIRFISETKRQILFSTKSEETWKNMIAFRKVAFGI